MESTIETAIAKVDAQTAKIEAQITASIWKVMAYCAGFFTLVFGLAIALIKFT